MSPDQIKQSIIEKLSDEAKIKELYQKLIKQVEAEYNKHETLWTKIDGYYDNYYDAKLHDAVDLVSDGDSDAFYDFCEIEWRDYSDQYINNDVALVQLGRTSSFYLQPTYGFYEDLSFYHKEKNVIEFCDLLNKEIGTGDYFPLYENFQSDLIDFHLFNALDNAESQHKLSDLLNDEKYKSIENFYNSTYLADDINEYINTIKNVKSLVESDLKPVDDAIEALENFKKNQIAYFRSYLVGNDGLEAYNLSIKEIRAILERALQKFVRTNTINTVFNHKGRTFTAAFNTKLATKWMVTDRFYDYGNGKIGTEIKLGVADNPLTGSLTYEEVADLIEDDDNLFENFTFNYSLNFSDISRAFLIIDSASQSAIAKIDEDVSGMLSWEFTNENEKIKHDNQIYGLGFGQKDAEVTLEIFEN